MSDKVRKRKQFFLKFQVSLQLLIIIILCLATAVSLWSTLSISKNISTRKAHQLFEETGQRVEERIDEHLTRAMKLAYILAAVPGFQEPVSDQSINSAVTGYMIETLRTYPELYSLYTGFPDGSFLQVIHTRGNAEILSRHSAPAETAFIIRTINREGSDNGNRIEKWTFLNGDENPGGERSVPDPEYNPVNRIWYRQALEKNGSPALSSAYIFSSLQEPGLTASCEAADGIVAGVDITLTDLQAFLESIDVSPGTGMVILDDRDRILAASSKMEEWLQRQLVSLDSVRDTDSSRAEFLLQPEGEDNSGEYKDITREFLIQRDRWTVPGGNSFRLIIISPRSDFLGYLGTIQKRMVISTLILLVVLFPFVVLSSRRLSSFLVALSRETEKIRDFDFSGNPPGKSFILEFQELADAFTLMKKTIRARTEALEIALGKLERIIEIGVSMTVESDTDRLTEMILKGAKELSCADGGSLYLKGEDDALDFRIVMNDSLGIYQGGTSGESVEMPSVELYREGKPNYNNVVTYAYHTGKTIALEDAYDNSEFDFSGTRVFDKRNGYRSRSFLTVPLKIQGSGIIGALQLINSISPDTGEVVPFDADIQDFIETLSAEAAAVLYNRSLLDSQARLFESMLKLIAGAIDAKSPHTGSHCARVPELSLMLAQQAEKHTLGPLGEFRFPSPQDKEAFRIASWLHDCGKLTSPEFVTEKSVKLETIHNRIHEIRARFEIMLRDIRLEEKDSLLRGGDPEKVRAAREAREKALFDDFTFIARCNTGFEAMDNSDLDRLRAIGEMTWYRNFDKSLGISEAERRRIDESGTDTAPGFEQLLTDAPEHIIPHPENHREKFSEYNLSIEVPTILYNRGELYNLSVVRGTLTNEERYKINEHIIQTMIMLDSLPFPQEMNNVSRYASSHHEKLTGSGYPRGIGAAELSYPERILAIADIFEALTAHDRPYKKRNTLSEAVALLHTFKESGHIDPDLFDLFLTSGVYREYAEKFLSPDQIDDVDIEPYLG